MTDDNDRMMAELEHAEQLKRLYGMSSDLNEKLLEAMKELASTKNGKMDFRGKLYATVALRVEMLRKHLGTDVDVITEIIERTPEEVVMKASVVYQGRTIATGYAEEVRGGKGVNSTSALENCETSAVGRALAGLGLGGGEYASADELSGAVNQQQALEQAIKHHRATIDTIKEGLTAYQNGDPEDAQAGLSMAAEAWFELSDDEKKSIWVAPTKGGPFTTKERELMKAPEFRQAYYGPDSNDNSEGE